ncbi:MAG: hypothetical protein A2140_08155 [Candidatus Muproteobacteria bacterium RBG_16_62_13]|uniref:SPOR domain-containing protein n=1 Tax=Candidatus Muproteobacteria bacterium RBG_16_62_13 TaxID=1817756 RepID=A0A1F6T8D4_9PROT|nr:MAG: hypothetical protein A2140_08155 [Candidatus Muproteobacteria bacterium RBG_16_62_13]
MKWIVGLLVLINLGVLMWILWYAEPEVPPIVERTEVAREKLRPIGERGVPLQARAPRPAPVPVAPAPDAVCFRLGPFAGAEAAGEAGQRLTDLKLAYESREEKQMTVTGYRVYLSPYKTLAQAEAVRRELRRKGFRDHVVMTEAGFKNAVSLGLFTVEENARRHLRNLAAKGFKAQLQFQHQVKSLFWLEVRSQPDQVEALRALVWKDTAVKLAPDAACTPAPVAAPPAEKPAPAEKTPPADKPAAGADSSG